MNKVIEIITAWAISINPTDEQKALAEKRLEICKSCENWADGLIDSYCKACGCMFKAKVFTTAENGCPLGKW